MEVILFIIIVIGIPLAVVGSFVWLESLGVYRRVLASVRVGDASRPEFIYAIIGDKETIEFRAAGHRVMLLNGKSFFVDGRPRLRPTLSLRKAITEAFPDLKAPSEEEALELLKAEWGLNG